MVFAILHLQSNTELTLESEADMRHMAHFKFCQANVA